MQLEPCSELFEIIVYSEYREYITGILATQDTADKICRQLSLISVLDVKLCMYDRIKAIYRIGDRIKTWNYEDYYLVNSDLTKLNADKFKIHCSKTKTMV